MLLLFYYYLNNKKLLTCWVNTVYLLWVGWTVLYFLVFL
jgi:hypothetical protein